MVNGSNGLCRTYARTTSSVSSLQSRQSKFGEDRYFKISERIYKELDQRLAVSTYLSGDNYIIADIATFPWIARHEWHDIGLKISKSSEMVRDNFKQGSS